MTHVVRRDFRYIQTVGLDGVEACPKSVEVFILVQEPDSLAPEVFYDA